MELLNKANRYERKAIEGDYEYVLEHTKIGSGLALYVMSQLVEHDLFTPPGGPTNHEEWLSRAAYAGHTGAMVAAARGHEGEDKFSLLVQAAELDEPSAFLPLSSMFMYGEHVEYNLDEALTLILEATRFEIPYASMQLGDFHLIGEHVEQNLDAAESYYEDARKQTLSPGPYHRLSEFDLFLLPEIGLGEDEKWSDNLMIRDIQDRLSVIRTMRKSGDNSVSIEDATDPVDPWGRSTLSLLGLWD